MTSILVTQRTQFRSAAGGHFFAVEAGIDCGDALNASSELLQGVEALCNRLIDGDLGAIEANAIKALAQQAKALIDASVVSVERASNLAPLVGGAGGAA